MASSRLVKDLLRKLFENTHIVIAIIAGYARAFVLAAIVNFFPPRSPVCRRSEIGRTTFRITEVVLHGIVEVAKFAAVPVIDRRNHLSKELRLVLDLS